MKKILMLSFFTIVMCFIVTGCGCQRKDYDMLDKYSMTYSSSGVMLQEVTTGLEKVFEKAGAISVDNGKYTIKNPDNGHRDMGGFTYEIVDGNNKTTGTFKEFSFNGDTKSGYSKYFSFRLVLTQEFEHVVDGDTYTKTSKGKYEYEIVGNAVGKGNVVTEDWKKKKVTFIFEKIELTGTKKLTKTETTVTRSGQTETDSPLVNEWEIDEDYNSFLMTFKMN